MDVGVIVGVGVKVSVGSGVPVGDIDVTVGNSVAFTPQAESAKPAEVMPANLRKSLRDNFLFILSFPLLCKELPNGLRYLRWGGDGEAVQPEKG